MPDLHVAGRGGPVRAGQPRGDGAVGESAREDVVLLRSPASGRNLIALLIESDGRVAGRPGGSAAVYGERRIICAG
jgi:hypothetical protein